ncbi:MAG: transposase [Rhodocyclaceae bacterium]|nr:transposase [Rhodocyclaceae bacterium]
MARLRRLFLPSHPLHVIQRGNNREPIFAADEDYRFYLRCLKEAAGEQGLAIHAYVLMTNHVHLLVTPESESSVSKTMQSVGRRYVQHFNHCYGRTGTLWEGRYKSTLIDSEFYLLTCMCYIEMNPVRAAMVERPEDYPWSSYRRNALGEPDALVLPHPLYQGLGRAEGKRQEAYRALFHLPIPDESMTAIRDATNKAWVLGDSRFRDKVSALSHRRASPLLPGRPKKHPTEG